MANRIGVCQWCLDRTGIDAVFRAQQLGFSALQIGLFTQDDAAFLSDERVRDGYRRAAELTGVELVAIALNIFNVYGITLAADNPRSAVVRHAFEVAIETAAAIGASLVYAPSFTNGEIHNDDDLQRTVDVLREACIFAADHDVSVCTENTLRADGHLRIVEGVNQPNLRVFIDAYNPVVWGHHAADLVRQLAGHMCDQIHMKDGTDGIMGNAPLNTGDARLAETVAALGEIDFDGYLISENLYDSDAEARAQQDINTLQDLFNIDG